MTLSVYLMYGGASDAIGNGTTTSVLIPVSKSSVVFEKVLAPLQESFLYGASKEAFRYPSAFLFNNSILQEKYKAFRANRREAGYSEEELREGYGFLLFDDIDKAAKLGETGVLTGNSTCKTLGDPSKGVYIARYSDCLAPDHWYSGKSGFIVIIKLTKGRSNKVKENYTQNCISPSVGFDCHESIELPMVSANTSSFLAYERTQYYLYEALPSECSNTNPAPSHVCPFAIVPFSYDDANTKATISSSQEQRETEGKVLNDFMWSGQLHISSQIFHVRLKSRSGTVVPVKLPPVVKVDQAVSMVTLRQFAPKAVFETRFSGEVCLDGICCSVHEFIPEELEDPSLSLLIRELKDKDLGLTVHLNESGFLILLHSSNFATCTGNQSRVTEALQAMFLFPGSRTIQRDTRGELEHFQISSDILQILPALDYAETEMQKIPIGPSGDIRGQFEQQIKNYAALVQTGLAENSSKDISPLSQDYDESVTSLFSNPKWTNRLWQWLRSYLSHPHSFQLPVYSVTELMAAGNKLQKQVFNEDLPSVEQAPGTICSVVPEELLTRSTAFDVSSSWQRVLDKKDSETNSVLNDPLLRNPTAELVVSITSAEGTSKVVDEGLRGSDAVVASKQLSNTPMATTNSVDKNPLENTTPGVTQRKPLGRPRGRPKGKRKRFQGSSPPADEPLNSTAESPDEKTNLAQSRLDNDSPETEWTILSTSQCKAGKLTYKYKKVPRSLQLQEDEKQQTKPRRSTRSTRYDPCSLLRKTDRWDLRPILTACGRTLVPHGSLNSLLQKNECESTDLEQHFKETGSETSEEASQLEKTDPVAGGLAANIVNSVDTCPNTELGSPRCETSSSQAESRVQPMVLIAEADSTGGVQSSAADDSLPLQYRNNSERLLFKLKKLFSRKKNTQLVLDDSVLPVDATLSTEPSLKKSKSDMDGEPLSTESNTECQDSRGRNKDVLIAFAQALGLTPIVPGLVPGRMEEIRPMVSLQPGVPFSPEAQLVPLEVESAQVLHGGPLPIQEKPKVERPLKKRRRKWGKDLTTPSSSDAETPENEESTKSNSVETNLKELLSANGQSNALSLLADLALGDGNNQAQPQLDPLSMKKPDPRSDVDNCLNDGTKPDNRSVLPSTLQHPADSPLLPPNCPSPEGILGSKDVIGLIAQEHDYSWSSASQMPNTSSPAGIPEHSQKGPLEGSSEHRAAVGHMTRDAIGSRRFRRSRTFVERKGVLQVTRKWKGSYDFDLDSKFTNHPVEKTVCRGLHGAWNSAGKDGGEEAQLLIHMWIGLFYSRSTPRFIHSSPLDLVDCPEKSDGIVSAPTVPETAPVVIGHLDVQDLEPIQEDQHFLNQGEEILDLSIKKQDVNDGSDVSVSHHEMKGKEASEAITRDAGRPDEGPAQCQAIHRALEVQPFYRPSKLPWAPNLSNDKVQPMAAKNVDVARVDQVYKCLGNELENNDINDVNIIKSTSKRSDTSKQSATNLEHSAVNSLSEDKTCDSSGKVIANIIIQPQLIVEAQASIDPVTSEMEERKENLENAEVAGDPPIEMDSACDFMKGIAEDGIKENDRAVSKGEDHLNNADYSLPLMDYEDPTNGHKSPVPYVSLPDDETQSAVRSIPLPLGSNENWNENEDGQSARDQVHFAKEDNHLEPISVSDRKDDPGGSDVSVVSCDPQKQDDKLVGKEVETASILAQNAASHQRAHSPLNGVSKLVLDPSEMPLVGKDDSKQEVEAGPQVLPSEDSPVELADEPKEMPLSIYMYRKLLENGEKVPIEENVHSVSECLLDSTHKLGSEDRELDKRCPPPTKVDGPGYFTLSLVGEPYEGDGTKEISSDEMLWMQYANTDSFMADGGSGDYDDGDDAISEGNFNLTLDESIPEEHDDDSMDDVDSEIESQQSNSDNHSTPLQEGIEGKSQAKVETDMSAVSCTHSYDDLVENEVESAYILAKKAASHHPSHSLQDGVSKLLQDSNERPLDGKDDSKQAVEAGPRVLPLQDSPVELVHKPKEMPMSIDVFHMLLENGEKVQPAQNILSVFQDRDSKHELSTEDGKLEERCLTPTKWDGPVVYCQATLVQQSCESDGKKDAASDDMLQMQCENSKILMAGGGSGDVKDDDQDDASGYDTISEENLSLELDKTLPDKHDNNDSKDETNVKIVIPQDMSINDSTPIKNGFGVERQAKVEPDVSVVICNHQEPDDELVGKEVEAASILAQKAASRQPSNSPQDGVSKLLQDSSEMPLIGKHVSKREVDTGPQVLPLQDSPVELAHEPKEMALNIDVYRTPLENGDKVQIANNLISVFEDRDSTHKSGSEDSEEDERCLPPNMGDGPVGYFTLSIVGEPYEGIGTKDAETAFISAQKAASPQPSHYPQYGVDSKQEVEAGPQVLHLETAIEPNEMGMNTNVFHMLLDNSEKVQKDENVPSAFKECNYENKLGSETSEFDERCPTPTVDEDPYEEFPSRISNKVCKIVPEEECGKSSALSHLSGKEVDAGPVLKAGRDQNPGRDLLEDNQTPSYRLLETIELPPSLHQGPALCSESMNMDNLNDGTRLVNVGITPAKKSLVKRKRSRFSDIVPCPPKKMNIIQEICEAPVRVLTGLERTEVRPAHIYRVKYMDNQSLSKTSDDNQSLIPVLPTPLIDKLSDNRKDISNHTSKGDQHENEQEICSRADRVSVLGVGECVPKQTNDIDAFHHVEERGHLKPSRTVPSSVSMQSGEGENLSSSSCQDPFQDCPVEKGLGPSSFNYTDPSSSSFKYTNYRFTKTVSNSFGNITEKCMNSDLTQFSIEQDFLIFSEEMKKLLYGNKRGPGKNPNHRSMNSHPSSDRSPSIIDRSMDEDMPESGLEEPMGKKRKNPSSRRGSTEANGALCDIEAVSARSYRTMMDNVCAGKSYLTETDGALRECSGPIKKMRSEMFGGMNQGLNMVVRKSSNMKFKFFILTTSEDAFFKDTKAQLEGAGHTEEQPYHFLLSKQSSSSSLLLIILKNEDIAEHIIKVPHLLQLKKSANVLFAGIDHPKDIGNLTHQDIFKKGGFIMLEGASLDCLSFGQMKALLDFLQELSRNGKWKWILHYRDIRRLKENSRFNAEMMDKKNLMKSSQETGIVEVLPYHECDQTCRPHPRYLKCLMQLQVQNITARYPVFVTDITNPTEDRSFERHGILTMNINTLLNVIERENFSPSTSI
ncbi:uncharacterized protein tasor2 isoform X1 [Gadus chalcogrammus]|uniref:uncharacterized protein tasor2 isoform X1 n=1 Tax=Gadus chalcogrammus TaxID=1042646 RepID=UPI0024C4DDFD|nr:uncharacterized protein tasor2 isoform X1 [Gadus chalcogrammus]